MPSQREIDSEIGNIVIIPARSFRLQVPWLLAAGKYEHLTDEELEEHYYDIKAERERRRVARTA